MAASSTRLQTDEIVAAAADTLAQEGPAGLSMRRLAERLGVTAGALYNHVPDKRTLEDLLIAEGMHAQGAQLDRAIDGADDRVTALAVAARAFALDHPHLYRLMTARDMDRSGPIGPAEQAASAPVRRALGGSQQARIAFWAFAHGMISLELNDRFPPGADVDGAWQAGLAGLRTQLGK